LRCHAGTVAIGSLVHTALDGPHRCLSTLERFATAKVSSGATTLDQSFGGACICLLNWCTLPIAENLLK
jgi:hypothetical protein